MKAAVIIPVRYASMRLPGKALMLKEGKCLFQIVYEKVSDTRLFEKVIIATDDRRIFRAAEQFGADVVMTSRHHKSGTDRTAEVAGKLSETFIINVQGDEPQISASHLRLIYNTIRNPGIDMATLAVRIRDKKEIADPNVVKIALSKTREALYFSRSPVPFDRDAGGKTEHYKHLGVYAYRRKFLLEYAGWSVSPLEKAERLEQLRAVENGVRIKVGISKHDIHSIDTPADWKRYLAGS